VRKSVVILVASLVPALAACGAGDPALEEKVRRAAETTSQAGGARVAVRGVVPIGTARVYRFVGTGIVDREGSTDIESRYSVIKGEPVADLDRRSSRAIRIGNVSYFTYPLDQPLGKKWAKVNWGDSRPAWWPSVEVNDLETIDRLLDTEKVRIAGRDNVRGVPTTHYVIKVDLRRFPRLAPPEYVPLARRSYVKASRLRAKGELQVEFWVDQRDLVRRMRERLSLTLPGYDEPASDETTDFLEFGLKRIVKPPPASDTEELTPDTSSD
jgi:hypothetical protein